MDYTLMCLLPDRPLHCLPCPHGHHHCLTELVGLGDGHRLLRLVQRDLVGVAGQACVYAKCAEGVTSKQPSAKAAHALHMPIHSTP